MTRKILLVDDDGEFVDAMRTLLEAHGFEVASAPNGAEGIKKAGEWSPDLMILDVMMTSDTEGIDVSRQIRGIPALKSLPVILLTGIRRAMNLPFGFEPDEELLPVAAVLEKPVQPEKLLAEIEKQFVRP